MLSLLVCALLMPRQDPGATYHRSDAAPATDPQRPISEIRRDGFTLEYVTAAPSETRVRFREGGLPGVAFGHPKPTYRELRTEPGKRTVHRVQLTNLKPGTRYYYQVWDPAADPTAQEANWGAGGGWRREYAVSTLAPKGQKTVIHLPVKVLLMPNVVHLESAWGKAGSGATLPPRATPAQIARAKEEFAIASRFFWVHSGMRFWVDFQIFVDERWQRWGPPSAGAPAETAGWPVSRSWAGVDYADPGGGDFTILDTKDPLRVTKEPIVEPVPYAGQVEVAWMQRWNANARRWEYANSGGGTYGIDGFPQGFPGRSQYLGGGDLAWLTAHEFHHQMESYGAFSLSNREDERIVFNHYDARRRLVRPDGSVHEVTWTTSGRHGEHWDGMAFWDRLLTDAQWLRLYFGQTITVRDADMDGVPDDDARLPLDEKRFGSDPRRAATDGEMNDLAKAMLGQWVPGPLQSTWTKPAFESRIPNPRSNDQDGDGRRDLVDPEPMVPFETFIVARHATVDGDPGEWADVPPAGRDHGVTFKHSHDEAGYYGLLELGPEVSRIDAVFDGEGLGVYSGVAVIGMQVRRTADGTVAVRDHFAPMPGLTWKSTRAGDRTFVEYRMPNRGEAGWFWTRGGREMGVAITIWDTQNRGTSLYEPFRPVYFRMLEPVGKPPMPARPPTEITEGETLLPGDPKVRLSGGWKVQDGTWRHTGEESSLLIEGLKATEFDLWVEIEGKSDGILAAFLPTTARPGAGVDYVAFVGGYGNRSTRLRLFGQESGDEPVVMTPGRRRLQLTRRAGEVWLLVDGKPVVWAIDPNPKALVDRIGVLGGYGGDQIVHRIRLRS